MIWKLPASQFSIIFRARNMNHLPDRTNLGSTFIEAAYHIWIIRKPFTMNP